MDLPHLGKSVQGFFEQGLAGSTNRTYSSAKNRYIGFCTRAKLSPYPLTQSTLCLFAAFLAQQGLAPQSISIYLSAVRHMEVQVAATASTRASWPYLQYVLKGIKRTAGRSPSEHSLTPDILRRLSTVWRGDPSYLHLLLWTVACVAFFGFMRMGEVTAVPGTPPSITADGVAVDSHSAPSIIQLTLTHSKTDQFRRGSHTFLGKTGSDLCPVEALLQFLVRRPGPRVGPLFIHKDGRPLTRDQFVSHLKEALSSCGIDSRRYSGHSFRIGAATAAAQAGVPDHLIKTLGRWDSEAYQSYIQTPPPAIAAVSSILAHGQYPQPPSPLS